MKDLNIFMTGNCLTSILITRTKNVLRPLKNITTSLQIFFFVSYNEDKISKLNKHLGNIINNVLEIKKMININQWHFHIVKT